MEKSHYLARSRYFRHTRHGGGKYNANNWLEVFQWFYRQVFHHSNTNVTKIAYQSLDTYKALQEITLKKIAYNNSSAKRHFYNWLCTQKREGRKWASRNISR